MTPRRTHYDSLGLDRSATPTQIREAYRSLARLLHPDHLAQVPLLPPDRVRAEQRIRDVNEAWYVLSDPSRKRVYDRSLGPKAATWEPPWQNDVTPQPQRPPRRSQAPKLTVPWAPLAISGLVLLGLILALAVVVGLNSESPPPRDAVNSGVCIVVHPGPESEVVPCEGPNDGRVVAQVDDSSECPAGTQIRRLDAGSPQVACLEGS